MGIKEREEDERRKREGKRGEGEGEEGEEVRGGGERRWKKEEREWGDSVETEYRECWHVHTHDLQIELYTYMTETLV